MRDQAWFRLETITYKVAHLPVAPPGSPADLALTCAANAAAAAGRRWAPVRFMRPPEIVLVAPGNAAAGDVVAPG